jgi:type II secretory pathway pseudopilin PulG
MKKGISLIVLVITIVISLILLTVAIMSFSQSDMTGKVTEVSFKSTARAYQDTLMIYISNRKMDLASSGKKYDSSTLNANDLTAWDNTEDEIIINSRVGIKAIIPNIKNSDIALGSNGIGFSVKAGKLVYNNVGGSIDSSWLEILDIEDSVPPVTP